MRRDILSLFLLLVGVSVFAQPGVTGPNFDETKDAKLIFSQDFESDWETWTTTPVNIITQVEYYRNEGTQNSNALKPWENPDQWQRGLFRDTLINLFNGVVITTNNRYETWRETVENNSSIVYDNGSDKQMRNNAMAAFGESDLGGDSYFKFVTDSAPKRYGASSYSTSTGLSARYVRYLAVHGLDIEELSSYRLTFYVKAKALEGHEEVTPTMYTEVMRGTVHSEKPLTMGYINDPSNYQFNNKYEYTKNVFNGDWEKVTYMTYYLTDSVAENYFFADGYWWAEDSAWFWSKNDVNNTLNKDLFYVVQPKNFFVRIGFASNYTEFLIDNLSLTKSTIGGIEYYQDKMRVDFGYETNLRNLAIEAYKKTRIDAIEIPNQYYEVWGLLDNGQWERVNIATAEYHGDGYMYLFTGCYVDPQTGEAVKYTLDHYRKVLVSFTNPTESELELKYTGTLFPNAIDVEWIKAGKRVLDFNNEEAKVNPYVFENIYSIGDRPPVLQKALIESGSFGLDGSIRELKFKFSREMAIDNPDNEALREKCIVYVNEEVWDRTWSASDSMLVLSRPSKYTAPLSGDYMIEIYNIYIPNTQTIGDDVTIHYNFGPINRDLSVIELDTPIWDALFYDRSVNPGSSRLQPAGTAALYYTGWSNSYTANLEIGNGYTQKNTARLYFYTNPDTKYPAALSLSPRGRKEDYPASLYLGYGDGFEININKGSYAVKFAAASLNKNVTIKLFVYPYDQEPHMIDAVDKVEFGEYSFTSNFPESIRNDENSLLDTVMTEMHFGFEIDKPGRYIVEIQCISNSSSSYSYTYYPYPYPCALLSDIQLYSVPTAYNPIRALNDAVAAAQVRIALATEAKYKGAAYTTLSTLIEQYKLDGSFYSTKPSDWKAAAKETENSNRALMARMDTVDLFVAKANEVIEKLTNVAENNANWTELLDYQILTSIKREYDAYVYSSKTNADLIEFIKQMDDAIKNLDARIAANKKFHAAMNEAQVLYEAKEQETYIEYLYLEDIYDYYEDFDTLYTTDEVLQNALAIVSDAVYSYKKAVGLFNVGTRRIKELDKLAKDLGSTIVNSTMIKDRLANLRTDDDDLAEIYKAAIKVAIYEKGVNSGELDLSPFLKNYYLYATPVIVDAMDVRMPETRSRAVYSYYMGYLSHPNIVNIRHQYMNDLPIWMILTQHNIDNLLPGWTVNAGNGGGNDMTCLADIHNDSIFKYAVFDATLTMDWGSEVALSTKIEGLPAGEYELGLDIRSKYDASQKTSRGVGELNVKFDSVEVSTPTITTFLGPDSILVENNSVPGQFVKTPFTGYADSTVFTSVNFKIGDGKVVDFKASLAAANGYADCGDFKMTFKPDSNFNYSKALINALIELDSLLGGLGTGFHTNPANSDYRIYMDSITTRLGSQVVIPIKMKNVNPITAFSFDLYLPTGMSYVGAELSGLRDNGHSLSINNNDKFISFACLSLENSFFSGNDGTIINLIVDLSNMDGDYSIIIGNVEMVLSAAQVYNPEYFVGNVYVQVDHNPGDLNRDSIISITDAVGVIDFITNSSVQNLDRHAADANQDRIINVSDLNLIVDYVIKGQDARALLGEQLNGQVTTYTEGLYGIYLDNIAAYENSQIVIPIKMKNAGGITAYSFDLSLPAGISFVSAELAGTRTNHHNLYSNYRCDSNENAVSIACLSLQNNTYSQGDGTVINLTLNVAEDVEGVLDITIGNIEMAVSATLAYNPEDFTGNLTVNPVFDPADVNKDGKISIADAVGVVSFIINSDIQGLDRHAADANQDGTIDVTDVVWIINRVIGKSYAPSRRSTSTEISSTLALDYVLNTTSSSLSVKMEGLLNEITAVQFNVTLPSGLSLKKFSTSDTHMFASNRQEDGSYTVVCFSLTNSTFVGGGESVFEVEFDLDDSFQSAPVTLNNIKLVTPDCRTKTIESLTISLSGSGPETGIIGVNDDSEFNLYDLQGRQIDKANGIFIRDNKKMMQAK